MLREYTIIGVQSGFWEFCFNPGPAVNVTGMNVTKVYCG
jgi:hypothetical protein